VGSHLRSAEPRVTDSPRRGYTLTVSNIASSILRAIGNTPLVQLHRVVPAGSADVLVKLESVNPTGSYKDRMALAMIEGAEARGDLRPGMRVVEFTGGSTGSSLGMVCAAKGYPFVLLSSDAFAREKLLTMTAFGADLRIVPSDGGKVTPALFERFRSDIAKLAAEPDTFWTDQFHNTDALEGYAGIGRELLEQTGGCTKAVAFRCLYPGRPIVTQANGKVRMRPNARKPRLSTY